MLLHFMCYSQCQGQRAQASQYSIFMVGNRTCPSSVSFGQDIVDLGVTARTQLPMVNSPEYKTLEDQAQSQHEASISAALA